MNFVATLALPLLLPTAHPKMKTTFFALLLLASSATPTLAQSNKARMCNALYAEIEHVARSYQRAQRLGSSDTTWLRQKGERLMNQLPAECR